MGVSGCGKSTVASCLADRLGWELQEGDNLHPASNVTKCPPGSLNDDDRWPWLDTIATWVLDHTTPGRPGIITCSALKGIYRDRIRGEHVLFVQLSGSRETVGHPLSARNDHFMPASLLDSQPETLEPPEPDQLSLTVDVALSPAQMTDRIIGQLNLTC